MALLDIKNLSLYIDTGNESIKALDKVSLTLDEGEIRALVGESGSGKSLIVRSIIGALPSNWSIKADRINYKGQSLLGMSRSKRREVMRREIAVVFQEPTSALDPSVNIKEQIKESIPPELIDKKWFWQRSKQREQLAISLLHKVGIKNHQRYLDSYPHEIPTDVSQKIMIAMALASEPKILIADDSTRGMESTTKTQILRLLTKLNKTKKLAILFVSHDLLAITSMSHTMTVLYCGQTVESGKVKSLLKRPLHPYTKALLDSAPSFQVSLAPKSPLVALEGTIPTLQHLPTGCRLGPRCPNAKKDCVIAPVPRNIQEHYYSCHFPLHLPNVKKADREVHL
ncbi:oligopeptide/dipeptide ABC transporter ATP-binding protein [Glaciecola sp. 1036]|uniref:oligopeptide/dipeptide ABC transporter ATP-binding protein n=1 Tax=Alteromonadaceae TaxID=72275 RepID=UPI003CFF7B5D